MIVLSIILLLCLMYFMCILINLDEQAVRREEFKKALAYYESPEYFEKIRHLCPPEKK